MTELPRQSDREIVARCVISLDGYIVLGEQLDGYIVLGEQNDTATSRACMPWPNPSGNDQWYVPGSTLTLMALRGRSYR